MRREAPRMSEDHDDRERTDAGTYAEQIEPKEVLALFTDAEPRTAKEVADALDVSRRTALNKLNKLVDRGEIQRKEVGARAVVFWNPNGCNMEGSGD